MAESHPALMNKPVRNVFFQYFFPSLAGMMLMSVNILTDGIFVGNGVGEEALAGVNLSMPVFSLIFSMALWIGIGGGTLFSVHMGRKEKKEARSVFSLSVVSLLLILGLIGSVGYFFIEETARLLGANEDTLFHTMEYLKVLMLFGWVVAVHEALSIFVRNDGSPILSMVSLGVTAIANIILNYYMIFILGLGVFGAALATVLGSVAGLFVLLIHFLNKNSNLSRFVFGWSFASFKKIFNIGFPSFTAEAGMLVFVAGYNLSLVQLLGTEGVAAFSVVNYLHGFMFLSFFGIETALQPMISYYHGAGEKERIRQSVKIGEKTSVFLGVLLLGIGAVAAPALVSLFGLESDDVRELAIEGIRLFFFAYLFIGFNFVYMTYYQSIGNIRSAMIIILLRSFVFIVILLWALPALFGASAVWLSLPLAEMLVAALLFFLARKNVVR
ncbi:MATE family efflux transporter [Salimicrobium humidisoli]|uniref:Multidrug export protein MepA n=1 Tax=Salimicrobium humidisoli TaxID=2029857 RepID=A0ABX4HSH2_9BACI|nr:MATE family efflux transporter [Salimicrobium humidisoli]PBB06177.1 MATE family efflux transporter [Salimicrobium humidisoli]